MSKIVRRMPDKIMDRFFTITCDEKFKDFFYQGNIHKRVFGEFCKIKISVLE